jgi:hypothetical protein
MANKNLADVVEALNHYKTHFRRENLPEFEFSGLQALFPELELAPEVTSKWPEAWPHGWCQGVYFIFGSQVRLLYIGKASMRHPIGGRLSCYFQYARPGNGCRVVHAGWSEPPRFVAALAVPKGMAFEAPALEEFLIERLSPPDNVKGRVPVCSEQPDTALEPTATALSVLTEP